MKTPSPGSGSSADRDILIFFFILFKFIFFHEHQIILVFTFATFLSVFRPTNIKSSHSLFVVILFCELFVAGRLLNKTEI